MFSIVKEWENMAEKDKIPRVGIEMIVRLKNDKYHNYSFKEIAEILAKELNIHVTGQSVGYQYRKNKNMIISDASLENSTDMKKNAIVSEDIGEKISLIDNNSDSKLPSFNFKKNLTNQASHRKEFEQLSDEEYEKFMKGD